MGSNLEIFDPVLIAEWNDLCGKFYMDTIIMGGTLARVIAAGENVLITTDLNFGSLEGIATAMEDIAYVRGFGKEVRCESRALLQKYGGTNFAIQVKEYGDSRLRPTELTL
jgi:aldehyde:ferredoxin oxidoreductase